MEMFIEKNLRHNEATEASVSPNTTKEGSRIKNVITVQTWTGEQYTHLKSVFMRVKNGLGTALSRTELKLNLKGVCKYPSSRVSQVR